MVTGEDEKIWAKKEEKGRQAHGETVGPKERLEVS